MSKMWRRCVGETVVEVAKTLLDDATITQTETTADVELQAPSVVSFNLDASDSIWTET